MSVRAYIKRFGSRGVGFTRSFSSLSKDDPRYLKWRKALLARPAPWNKGYTKQTHAGVAKTAKTFKDKEIDNFAGWREKERKEGRVPREYLPLEKNEKLAFLTGMILGDGHLERFPRTELLQITLGTDKPLLWQYVAHVVQGVFGKEPYIQKRKTSACLDIKLYRGKLSESLGIPLGARGKLAIVLPEWILHEDKYLLACLRGLYEAEGSFCVHKPTYTYKMLFANRNTTLLDIVYTGLERLGFHPHRSKYQVQISKRREVYQLKELLNFRTYS